MAIITVKVPSNLRCSKGKPTKPRPVVRKYYELAVHALMLTPLSAWNRSRSPPKPKPAPGPRPQVPWR